MARLAFLIALVLVTVGCDNSEKIARLEKQNQELQAKVSEGRTTADYDLQAKCSRDASAWFKENWARDKDTVVLDFRNHYNKKLNKCFILVEYHYNSNFAGAGGSSWTNDLELFDVYENSKYGTFGENHYTYSKPDFKTRTEVVTCEILSRKCSTEDEFSGLMRPYLND